MSPPSGPSSPRSPASWPWSLTVPVRFTDLDAMGHVNNAVYLTYLEQARNDCYLELTGRRDILGEDGGLDFVVARAEIDYRAPVHHGESVTVTIRPEAVGRSSFTWTYVATNGAGAQVATARTVLVAYDWDRRTKKPLDPRVAELMRAGIEAA